ncbi:MAG: hypothetical protein GX890_05920 [Firmicutes bacterium]|jgi:hypothetical protein|nr:hypothetical protein [Bacillota bacterium]HPU00844.1 hypothetical protein [Bacillota bacterium]
MAGPLSRWINKLLLRRRQREEQPYFLAEYFSGEISEDEELASSEGLTPAEMERLRREFEE